MSKNYFEVKRAGINTTFQDKGRGNFYHIGIPFSGAMDNRNFLLANKLVANKLGSPVLEFAYQGPLLKYSGEKFVILGSNKLVLDDYILADLIAIIKLNKNLQFKAGYKNLFDYTDERRFLDEGSDFLTTYDPGRRFIIELKFNFDSK